MTAYNFPTHFSKAPNCCPMCGHKLAASNAIDGFDFGNICNCSSCQFEYIKAPDDMHGLDCGCDSSFFYMDNAGEWCCMQCEHAQAMTLVYAAEAVEKKLKDRIAALEAIVKEHSEMTSAEAQAIESAAKFISAAVIRMVRAEARAAVIEAFNMPVGAMMRARDTSEWAKAIQEAEQMDADRVEIGTAQITYLGKADPFIAID